MRKELRSAAIMGILLIGSQIVALAIAQPFQLNQVTAFPNPNAVSNTLIYVVAILAFTGVILLLVKYRRKNVVRYLVLGSIFVTIGVVLLLPYLLITSTLDPAGYLATILAFATAALVTWILVRYPEWYVVDSVGMFTAASVTAILGISFGWFPAFLLLVALAVYDAWAVYRTKHMVALADELTSQRLPVLLVIPKERGYKFSDQPGLREQIAKGEEREAMFMGLGDLIIPGILSVSAWASFAQSTGRALPGLSPALTVAAGTIIGGAIGFFFLMRFVLRGNPQAGLPLLNGGAIIGFFITYFLVFGSWIPPLPALS